MKKYRFPGWKSLHEDWNVNAEGAELNLIFAWTWILAGFVSGMVLGLRFHDENWLGGYASFQRRMYRLGHISFFGLGGVNLLFYLSVKGTVLTNVGSAASVGFVLGGVTMPICCWVMARRPRLQGIFAVPVLSLTGAGVLTLIEIIK